MTRAHPDTHEGTVRPVFETLPPRKTLNGKFDAYCHVCWRAIYCLWVDNVDPAGKCPHGAMKITDCEEAMGWARTIGQLRKYLAMSPEEQRLAHEKQAEEARREILAVIAPRSRP